MADELTEAEWQVLLARHKQAKDRLEKAEANRSGAHSAREALFAINRDIRNFSAREQMQKRATR